MNIINPFGKKPKDEEQMLQEEREFQRNNLMTDTGLNPQHQDERMMYERQQEMAELRRWQQDRDEAMKTLFEKLCGRRFVGSKVIIIPDVVPLTSINGAYQIINFIEQEDVNTMMSNFSETRINKKLRWGLGYPLVAFIKEKREDLGIEKKKAVMDYIIHLCLNTVEPTLYRALNAGERSMDSKIYKILRTEDATKQEQKKGIFG